MEKIEKYQNLIIGLLEEQVAPLRKMEDGELQEQLIIDTQHHHVQWLTIGWDKRERFINNMNIHFTIKPNGKIWLMENNTDIRIAEELVKLGVPRQDIVLGFQPPSHRSMTDYATA